ncbi:MAG: Gx transporter family protein [Lachnospiraceae bacterium]|jgi:heptaprenyl diphosphate synthase|nr:Gx transporter family protein [Lachnospiraceae bacterium]
MSRKNTRLTLKKMTTLTVFLAVSLCISLAESFFPPLVPIPGVRLGLANVVTLLLLYDFTPGETLLVLLMRIFLSAFCAGQAMSFVYSLCGGILCFLIMWFLYRFLCGRFLVLTSIFGALAHNAGQLMAACLFTGGFSVLAYAPVLVVSGILTGCFTGLCAYFTRKYLSPHIKKLF